MCIRDRFNTILAVDLKFSIVTRLVRHGLELSRLKEDPLLLRRTFGRLKTFGSIWVLGMLHPFSFSLLLRTFFGAVTGTRHDTKGHTAAQLLSFARRSYTRIVATIGRVLALLGFIFLWIFPPIGVC